MTQHLELIVAKDEAGANRLYACTGAGRGCKRNKYRQHAVPCDDCVGPLPAGITLQQAINTVNLLKETA